MDGLIELINTGNLSGVIEFLDTHPGWRDWVDAHGRTPLHHAAWKGRDVIVDFLLEQGGNIFQPDKCGSCPIHFAAQSFREETLKRILQWIQVYAGSDGVKQHLLTPGAKGMLPLEFAAHSGVDAQVKRLFNLEPEAFWISLNRNFGWSTITIDPAYRFMYRYALEALDGTQFAECTPTKLSRALLASIVLNLESIFDNLYQIGLNRYGWSWVVDTMLGRSDAKIIPVISFQRYRFSPSIFGRLEEICLQLLPDPFLRGRMYEHMMNPKHGMIAGLIQHYIPVSILSSVMLLLNKVGNHETAWKSLQASSSGYLPQHIAIKTGQIEIVEFLIGIGSRLDASGALPRRLNNTPEMIKLISVLEGDQTIPEKERLAIRNRVYFQSSLVWKLLFFI